MTESTYYYAIKISEPPSKFGVFLMRQNASAPSLFWFHEDAVKCKRELDKCKDGKRCDIVKVFVRWNHNGKTYNSPGNMFRSAVELKRKTP